MEIVQERLEREFNMDLVTTAPGVLVPRDDDRREVLEIDSPSKLPEGNVAKIEEPIITAMILTPSEHVGGILQLCQEKRGVQKSLEYLSSNRVLITYELPFNEVVLDFLRQAEDALARLRVARLSCHRLLGIAAREDGHSRQRRSGRCVVGHRASRQPSRGRALAQDATS